MLVPAPGEVHPQGHGQPPVVVVGDLGGSQPPYSNTQRDRVLSSAARATSTGCCSGQPSTPSRWYYVVLRLIAHAREPFSVDISTVWVPKNTPSAPSKGT
jgi:hypothetical protein